ncbi:peptidoglycan-binding protein [Nonomuraea sp. NPDC005983]|uniref:efflux RND transporter periplasmic adaptor subunit n=1 Tax=Nonomuraea sp. NPDC005983 TaxID=3155595 RepID=UPI0033AAAF51
MSAAQTADTGSSTGRRRLGRLVAVPVGGAMIAAGAWYARSGPFAAGTKEAPARTAAATALAQVTRGTLSARTMENGTLGYAGDYQVVNKAGGTVTRLPAVGQVISQGRVLYRVDGRPVVLLRGEVPVYRDLSWGTQGSDVRQLNAALVDLRYATKDEIDPDSDYFGRPTYYALKELQEAAGLEATGNLTLGQAVFVPAGRIRITKIIAVPGGTAAAGSVVLRASSTARQITVELSASRQSQVATGDKVTITLPNGKTSPGVVSSVGRVAVKADSGTTVDVRIKPLRPQTTGQLDQAPVQVSIVTDTVEDVLSVPVNALLALAGGGYAVEVVETDGRHRLIPVETGLFDDSGGKVEVTGDGLAAGQNIVVPST